MSLSVYLSFTHCYTLYLSNILWKLPLWHSLLYFPSSQTCHTGVNFHNILWWCKRKLQFEKVNKYQWLNIHTKWHWYYEQEIWGFVCVFMYPSQYLCNQCFSNPSSSPLASEAQDAELSFYILYLSQWFSWTGSIASGPLLSLLSGLVLPSAPHFTGGSNSHDCTLGWRWGSERVKITPHTGDTSSVQDDPWPRRKGMWNRIHLRWTVGKWKIISVLGLD